MKKHLVLLPFVLAAALACSLTERVKEGVAGEEDPRKKVEVPRGLENAEKDFAIYLDSSAFVAVPRGSETFFNRENASLGRKELGEKLERFRAQMPAAEEKALYLSAAANVDYASVADVLRLAEESKFERIRLVVGKTEGSAADSILPVSLPDDWARKHFPALVDPEAPSEEPLKPNPNTLLVEIEPNGKLTLNREEIELSKLAPRLAEVFSQRELYGVFREGTNEVEKTVFVKSARSVKYIEVARAIDALRKSGAFPIVMLTRDLKE